MPFPPRTSLQIKLNHENSEELSIAAAASGITERQFAQEALEAALAARRLERMPTQPKNRFDGGESDVVEHRLLLK